MALLPAWGFKKTRSTEAMKLGHVTEMRVRPVIPQILMNIGHQLEAQGQPNYFRFVTPCEETGLYENLGSPYCISSPDGDFFRLHETENALVSMKLECKGLSGKRTLPAGRKLQEDQGLFTRIHFKYDTPINELQQLLMFFGNRKLEVFKLIHHASVTESEIIYCLVNANSGEFLKIFHVVFDEAWRRFHRESLTFVICRIIFLKHLVMYM